METKFLLAIASLTLDIKIISSAQLPRAKTILTPSVEYSINGSAIGDGAIREPFLWSISGAFLTREESILLNKIYEEFSYRRANFLDANINLSDYTLPYTERIPRTLDIASGATETISGNYTEYYAIFKTWFTTPPSFEHNGAYNVA